MESPYQRLIQSGSQSSEVTVDPMPSYSLEKISL